MKMKKWKRLLAALLIAAFVITDLPSASFVTYAGIQEEEFVQEPEAEEESVQEPEQEPEAEPESAQKLEAEEESVQEPEAEEETVQKPEAEEETVQEPEAEEETVQKPEAEEETVQEPETEPESTQELKIEPESKPDMGSEEETEEEILLEETGISPQILLSAYAEAEDGIYWLPQDMIEGGINETYVPSDEYDGTSYKTPVRTLGKAAELAKDSGKQFIYAMSSWIIEEEGSFSSETSFTLKHCENDAISHEDAFFAVSENTSFSMNFGDGIAVTIGEDIAKSIFQLDTGSKISLSGNIVSLGTVNIAGYTGNGILDMSGLLASGYRNSQMKFSFDYKEAEAADCYKVQLADIGSYTELPAGFTLTDDEISASWELVIKDGSLWAEKRPTAIYLSDLYGDDKNNSGYTSSHPVKTFERAKEILEQYKDTVKEIRICDTIPANGTWDLSGYEEVKIVNADNLVGTLINAQGLSLKNITVENTAGAGITVNGGLTVDSGVTITSNTYGVQVQSGSFELDGSAVIAGEKAGIYLNARNYPIVLTGAVTGTAAFKVELNKTSFNADELPAVVTSKGGTEVQADQYLGRFSCTNLDTGERLAADTSEHVIYLEREPVTAVYIGGASASDRNPGTVEAPVATVNRALEILYRSMDAGYIQDAVIHVVGEVEIEEDETWDINHVACQNSDDELDFAELNVDSVTFLRQQREGTIIAYTGPMFTQKSGTLTIGEGIVLDGNYGKTGLLSKCGYVLDISGTLDFYGEEKNNYADIHVIVEDGGTLNFYGKLLDNHYTRSLFIREGGIVNIVEGVISGNQYGIENHGTLVIGSDSSDEDDERIQITGTQNADTIINRSTGTCTFNYGTFSKNSGANGHAYVIYNEGRFTMNGGVIKDCSAGGIYNEDELIITGGNISENGVRYTGSINGVAIRNGKNGTVTAQNLITEKNVINGGKGSSIYNEGTMLLGEGVEIRETTGVGQTAEEGQEYAVVSTDSAVLKLEGNVQIAGKICLEDFGNPVRIVSALTGDPDVQQFLLHLDQGWSGQKVVDLVDGIEDACYQDRFTLDAFAQKVLQEDGISYAEGKNSGDLFLLHKYYVYLGDFDGSGNDYNPSDNNDGASVKTAVRTFERAKEILEEKIKDKTEEEAQKYQIVLCGVVKINDAYFESLTESETSWDFGENTRCNTTLIRMESYTGTYLITVESGKTLKLGNIVIDGMRNKYWDSSDLWEYRDTGGIVKVSSGASLEMSEPAVLKNAKSAAVSVSGSFAMSGGTISNSSQSYTSGVWLSGRAEFTMTGGTIQGNGSGIATKEDNNKILLTGSSGQICGNRDGVYLDRAEKNNLTIENGFQIVDNEKNGIYVFASSGYSIDENIVKINNAFISGGLTGVSLLGVDASISNSTIKDFSNEGIYYGDDERSIIVENTTITGRAVEGKRSATGIKGAYDSASFTLRGSEISSCQTGIEYCNSICTIENSEIHDNDTGISLHTWNGNVLCKMQKGSKVHGNSTGVSCSSRAKFQLYDTAEIYENNIGMSVNGGDVLMYGGKIYDNSCEGKSSGSAGVSVSSGTFRMEGGEIVQNEIRNSWTKYYQAAGLYVGKSGSAQLLGGVIAENELTGYGGASAGGICIDGGTVALQGTKVTGNKERFVSKVSAGGICITNSGTLNMTDGEVSGNVSNSTTSSSKPVCVGGIYVESGTVNLSGGTIYDNEDAYQDAVENARKLGTGIYAAADRAVNFNGANAKISDLIRLGKGCAVTIEKALRSTTGTYILDVPTDSEYGTVVVTPKNANAPSASAFLSHFTSNDNKFVLMKSGRDIILGTMIFVDGVKGNDKNAGNAPDQSLLTVEAAITKLSDYVGIIYIVDTVTVSGSASWTLSKSGSYICRYTGFDVGATDYSSYANKKDMFCIAGGGALTIDSSITVDGGSDSINGGFVSEGSLFRVQEDGTLNVNGSILRCNLTAGDGGAVYNEGTVTLSNGVSIVETDAEKGSAVYQNGILNVSGRETVSGDIYLCGDSSPETSRVVHVTDAGFQNQDEAGKATCLQITIQDPYDEREVISYQEGTENLSDYLGRYQLEEEILEQYRFLAGTEKVHPDCLYLKEKGIVYVNGTEKWKQTVEKESGGWGENYGHYPDTAFATMEEAYEDLKETGGLIYIVGEVSVDQKMLLAGKQYQDDKGGSIEIDGTVSILRYARPTAHLEDTEGYYLTATYTGDLFKVTDSGELTMQELKVNGHSRSRSGSENTAAQAVTAESALIHVEQDGKLILDRAELRDNMAGGGADGGAVYNDGYVVMKGGSITNTASEGHGDSVYQNGELRMEKDAEDQFSRVEGDVYLCGTGQADNNSRYIKVQGSILSEQLSLEIADPYNCRKVIEYDDSVSDSTAEPAKYMLDEHTKGMYALHKRAEEENVLELYRAVMVYIDGVNGSDSNLGNTPDKAVKSLGTAYQRLKSYGGTLLYVVDTVTVSQSVVLTSTSVESNGSSVALTYPVTIRRYSQPDKAGELTGYTKTSNTNAMFCVDGVTLKLENLVIDGHREAVTEEETTDERLIAGGVTAKASLISVKEGGTLIAEAGTVFRNNFNSENTGGAVCVGSEKDVRTSEFIINGVRVENNAAKGMSGETAVDSSGVCVYPSGALKFAAENVDSLKWGDNQYIYLGAEPALTNQPSGNFDSQVAYITVNKALPASLKLPVDMDRENGLAAGRKVVEMQQAGLTQTADYLLAEGIVGEGENDLRLQKRKNAERILELQTKETVQINVTVPLYVCMYAYGGNGHVVTPSEDAYGISNQSNCAVQVTSVQATECVWNLRESMEDLQAGELFLQLSDQVVTEREADTSGNELWRMEASKAASASGEPEPFVLSVPIRAAIAGGSVNEDGEAKVCTVTYTVKAAED